MADEAGTVDLTTLKVAELQIVAEKNGIDTTGMKKDDIIAAIIAKQEGSAGSTDSSDQSKSGDSDNAFCIKKTSEPLDAEIVTSLGTVKFVSGKATVSEEIYKHLIKIPGFKKA